MFSVRCGYDNISQIYIQSNNELKMSSRTTKIKSELKKSKKKSLWKKLKSRTTKTIKESKKIRIRTLRRMKKLM